MVTTEVSLQLSSFIYEQESKGNNLGKIKFLSFVGHKLKNEVYGALFKTDKGLLFVQHKWVRIKIKKVPSVCAKEKSVFKFVNEDIYNSFENITLDEHSNRWGTCLEKI